MYRSTHIHIIKQIIGFHQFAMKEYNFMLFLAAHYPGSCFASQILILLRKGDTK